MTMPAAHLLIVDDEEMNRDMLGRRLEIHGYRVAFAEDGYEALEMVGQQAFDLILLDIMMPFLNGLRSSAASARPIRRPSCRSSW